jgi:hypothetical protein
MPGPGRGTRDSLKETEMQTPKIEDRAVFETKLVAVLASAACPICKGGFAERELFLSLHAHEFKETCTGTGKVWRVKLPWCPRCEREPETYGCVHQNLIPGRKSGRKRLTSGPALVDLLKDD